MNLYHVWCNLKDGVRDTEFSDRAEAYLGHLKKKGLIAGYRITRRQLEHLPTLRGHLMGQSGSFGQARRAARCGSSGKRRNAADEPLRPTEGRVLLSRGRVALLIRCPASHVEALLTRGQNNPGQMTA